MHYAVFDTSDPKIALYKQSSPVIYQTIINTTMDYPEDIDYSADEYNDHYQSNNRDGEATKMNEDCSSSEKGGERTKKRQDNCSNQEDGDSAAMTQNDDSE